MARRPRPVAVIGIQPFHAADAMNTIARAHEHLNDPKMMKAIKAHMGTVNAALTGGLKPKMPRLAKRGR